MFGELWRVAREQCRVATNPERQDIEAVMEDCKELVEEYKKRANRSGYRDLRSEPRPEEINVEGEDQQAKTNKHSPSSTHRQRAPLWHRRPSTMANSEEIDRRSVEAANRLDGLPPAGQPMRWRNQSNLENPYLHEYWLCTPSEEIEEDGEERRQREADRRIPAEGWTGLLGDGSSG